ncbi:hypothetical protein NLI96_g11485 [Meripilus lineatus]|uniref:Nucleoporin n=1 Tax=Meripilus lineatus TaxID=2056292 RepID=A0AAD5Y935_9APHY|nr:hypothetical protein NLI96_g11485 [Physisporinus lineatus]
MQSLNTFQQSTNGRPSQPRPTQEPRPTLDLPALQSASRVLHEQYLKDAQAVPELSDMLTIPTIQSSASYSVFPDDYRVPFHKKRLVSIPDSLFQYYNTTDLTTHMGLMPQIERVWVSIDHSLFLWDYIDGQELSSFVDQPDVITHVALVKPKPGVFIDDISSLLVICTPLSVLLLGVSSTNVPGPNNRTRKEIKLYATDISIPTEIEMTSVIGTQEGRIFMCGLQDGNLYELHYQEKEGWFGKRVQLINHSVGGMQSFIPRLGAGKTDDRITSVVSDIPRGHFYTLSNNNTISVYRTNGEKAIQHVQTLSNLYKLAQEKAPGSPALTPNSFIIVSLQVIEANRSQSGISLVAMTSNGVRLFFSSSTSAIYSYNFGGPQGGAARTLQLVHVRLPPANLLHPDEQGNAHTTVPGFGAPPQPQPPQVSRPYLVSTLDCACYDSGLMLASQQGDPEEYDFMLCLSPDLTRVGSLGRPPLTEYATLLRVAGRTWAMAPVPRPPLAACAATPPDCPAPVVINELANQFCEPAREFLVLTNSGVSFVFKRRSMDWLKDVIDEFQAEGNAQNLISFRDSFGRDQTCAMLLAIASGNTFLELGDESALGTLSTVSPEIAAVAKQAFYDFGERPMWSERVTYGTGGGTGTATFSGRREGLALYFARLVRPIWKAKITKSGWVRHIRLPSVCIDVDLCDNILIGSPGRLQQPNISEDVLVTVQKNLYALKELLDRNPHLFHSAPGDHTGARSASASEQEAWKAEQSSVAQLLSLLARTVEAISFVLLLADHKIGELISQCEADVQKTLETLRFEQLVTEDSGVQVSRSLVNVVINQQIGQQISVDTISEVLQQRCGSFCSTDDVMLYKARENVRKAAETKNPVERQNFLGESLRLFMKGARILEFDKLREVCGDYQQLNFAKGAVELPLYCANVFDANQQGQQHWAAGCPDNDPRAQSWTKRLHCYELVLDSLSVFESRCTNAKKQPPSIMSDDPETVRAHAYELSFASEDEMFHSTLYDWLIQRGVADELLEMRPVYLEAHLRREPGTVQKYQLLWQFYVKDKQALRAAEVLSALAESPEFEIPLDTRIEYLTLAVGNAKSHPVSAGDQYESAISFLTDMEEKLEVAQVQLELYNLLFPRINEPGEWGAKIKLLSKGLYNITDLFREFAEPLDLPMVKLLIFHVSEHRDEGMVRPIWNKIFEEAADGVEPNVAADQILAKVLPLGQRFYPSESAFPLRHIASLLVRFSLSHKGEIPYGWASRILIQCGVPYPEVWDILHEMYESQIPPFNDQANVQAVSSDIAVLLADWMDDAKRPQSPASRGEIPVYRLDQAIEQYLAELGPGRTDTKLSYESTKRQLRQYW